MEANKSWNMAKVEKILKHQHDTSEKPFGDGIGEALVSILPNKENEPDEQLISDQSSVFSSFMGISHRGIQEEIKQAEELKKRKKAASKKNKFKSEQSAKPNAPI